MRTTFALVFLTACSSKINDLALRPITRDPLVAAFPPDGTRRLRGDTPISVVTGTSELPSVVVDRDGLRTTLSCAFGEWPFVADCGELTDLGSDDEVSVEVTAGGDTRTLEWVPTGPAEGVGWSLLDGVDLTVLGGGATAPAAIDPYLHREYAMAFAALDGYDGTPGPWSFVAGQVGVQDDGQLAPTVDGFSFVVPVEVGEGGHVHGSTGSAWLGIVLLQSTVHVLVTDVHLSADLDGDALEHLDITATLPALGLTQIADALGPFGGLFLDLVQVDVDLDHDGVPDAASLRLEGSPAPAELSWWSPE